MANLPSTYQQVLKNMNQIAEDHALLSDPTDGLVAVATKVNHPTNGIDKINSRLNDPVKGLDVVANKVNDTNTGVAALNSRLNNTINRVGELENDTSVLEKYTGIPGDYIYNAGTGVITDQNGNVVTVPEINYDDIVNLAETFRDRYVNVPSGGAIETTSDGITKVVGVHVNTLNNANETAPSTYKYGVTYEIKKITTVLPTAIRQRVEFADETYCLVATYTVDSKLPNESNTSTFNTFNPFQICVCPKSGNYFKRYADTLTGTWGSWTSAIRTMYEMAHIEGSAPPSGQNATDQLAGEFWYQTGIA